MQPRLIDALRHSYCTAVAAGNEYSVVITDEGGLYTFGVGRHGQLGHGDTRDQTLPKRVDTFAHKALLAAAGLTHTLVVCQSGGLFAFGDDLNLGIDFGEHRRHRI